MGQKMPENEIQRVDASDLAVTPTLAEAVLLAHGSRHDQEPTLPCMVAQLSGYSAISDIASDIMRESPRLRAHHLTSGHVPGNACSISTSKCHLTADNFLVTV
jgi:hypothetical protein